MTIGIGSNNKAKVKAVREAVEELHYVFPASFPEPIRLEAMTTETSVPDMPLNQQMMRKGALERALFVYNHFTSKGISIDLAVGLEGGVYAVEGVKTIVDVKTIGEDATIFLQNWVYVFDGKRGVFGSSASLPLPESIRSSLYREGKELAEVIDHLSGLKDVRSNNGAFGILTADLITRTQAFKEAVIAAMVPFLNKRYYRTD